MIIEIAPIILRKVKKRKVAKIDSVIFTCFFECLIHEWEYEAI